MGIFSVKHKKSFERVNIMGIDFEVKRSTRRKTISIKIQDAKVYLYVPFTLKLEKTLPFLLKKQNWIQANLQEQVRAESSLKKDFVNGDRFLFLGEEFIHFGYVPPTGNLGVSRFIFDTYPLCRILRSRTF